jgi:ligand-binding SRPBCC domain-containing protein
MADYVLERRVWLPRPRSEVFDVFADPRNLERLNPAWARPRWLVPPPARLAAGAVLEFRVAGLPGRWRVMIREFDPPYRFVDAQVLGPFARWEHRHRFREGDEGEGGTWVEDRVTYRLPLGPLGRMAHALGARRLIRALFAHRDARLRAIFT